ncbi:MAG: CDP-alcohol phosphatidyltransferase family protein [Clostridia bacterium]|nr:CDP-alcohol phosphatidyltransferase family protein [Clostridia bacterium]
MLKNICDKANILTYVGLVLAVLGIQLCLVGNIDLAVMCLLIAGICDGFDGAFARKLRKDGDPNFGVELDSLVDIISSGVFPVVICLSMGFNSIIDLVIYSIFLVCGVGRLAYYNITSKENSGYFTGVPITVSTILLPLIYVFTKNEYVFVGALLALSFAYVSNFKIKKLNLKSKIALSIVGILFVLFLIFRNTL